MNSATNNNFSHLNLGVFFSSESDSDFLAARYEEASAAFDAAKARLDRADERLARHPEMGGAALEVRAAEEAFEEIGASLEALIQALEM